MYRLAVAGDVVFDNVSFTAKIADASGDVPDVPKADNVSDVQRVPMRFLIIVLTGVNHLYIHFDVPI